MSTKKRYREFCKKFNVRYKLDDCGDPISPSSKRKYGDHMFWMDSSDEVGVYIERETPKKYNFLRRKLVTAGCRVMQDGDIEGTLAIDYKNAAKIAKIIGSTKREVTEEQRRAAKERMQKYWAKKE